MRKFISFLFGLMAFAVLAAFALANRRPVTVSFDPLLPDDPWLAVEVPLWAVLFAGIFLGLLAGGIATWLRQGRWRRRARHAERQLDHLRTRHDELARRLKEHERAAEEATAAARPPAAVLPAPEEY